MNKILFSILFIITITQTILAQPKERLFSYRSFTPAFNEMKDFAKHGVNTVAIFPANTLNSRGDPYSKYPLNWLDFDKYDWNILDKQLDDVIAINPDANFIFIVDLNSPIWLSRRLTLFTQSIESDSFTCLSNTLANPNWQKATEKYLKDLLAHTEKKYGKRIKAYLLACGMTDEWMDYSSYSAGRFKIQKWKQWLKKNGETARSVPALELFPQASFENFLRDPAKEADLIKFVKFNSELITDSISNFAKITRENISPDKQIGVFFGYIMELTGGRLVAAGHLNYEKLYADENIDFFQSPGVYSNRPIGAGSGFMCADGTRKRFKKGWLHEIDHYTHMCDPKINKRIPVTGFPGDNNRWKSPDESVAGLKREIALSITSNASLWFFDMVGGWFDTPEMMSTIQRGHKIWQEHQGKEYQSVAEIALITDPQSAMYVNDFDSKVGLLYPPTRNKLSLIGAPFETFSFNDIGNVDMSQYKFFIFPASFKIDKARMEILQKHIFKKGKTSLFLYAPAIIDDEKLDVRNVENFLGIKYGAKGLNIVEKDGHTIAYIHDYKDLDTQTLRNLAEKANVKMLANMGTVVYANEKFLAIHTKEGGKMKITLPFKCKKLIESFSGKTIGENIDSFEYNFSSPDTTLFEFFK